MPSYDSAVPPGGGFSVQQPTPASSSSPVAQLPSSSSSLYLLLLDLLLELGDLTVIWTEVGSASSKSSLICREGRSRPSAEHMWYNCNTSLRDFLVCVLRNL